MLWSTMLFVVLHRYWLTVGMASREFVAVLMAGVGGFSVGFRSRSFAHWSGSTCRTWGSLVLGLLCIASLWAPGATISLLNVLPAEILIKAPWLIPLSVSLVCVLPVSWLCGRLLRTFADSDGRGLLAVAMGGWVALSGLSMIALPLLGLFWLSIAAFGAAFLAAVTVRFVSVPVPTFAADSQVSSSATQSTPSDWDETAEQSVEESMGAARLAAWCGVFVMGVLAVAACAALRELIPPAFYLSVTAAGAVMLGAALGQYYCKPGAGPERTAAWWLAGLVWSLIWLASFPELTNRLLQANAHVSHVGLLMAIRWLAFTAWLLPLGFAWGGIATSVSGAGGAGESACSAAWRLAPAFLLGCCGCVVALAMGWTVPTVALSAGAVTVTAVIALLYQRWQDVSLRAKLAMLGAVVFVCFAPWSLSGYSPQTAARLLFATTVFQADLDGEDRELLQYMDGGRLLETAQGEFGTLTVWRFRGAQIQIREGGVPRSIASGDPRICPDYSAEIVPTVMGMVLHEDPRDVLVIGAGAGAPVQAALTFPTRTVHCAESDETLLSSVRRHVWSQALANPEQDERFHLHDLNPLAAILALPQSFDVIVSAPAHPSLSQSQPWLTREFYELVGAKLSSQGVFVQRFQQLDFDAQPLRALVATFQQVFAHTCAVEIAPGEVAVFGTNGSDFLRPGLVGRMRRPHVQVVLSRLGWDWSMLLDLPAYDHETLTQLAGDAETPARVNGVRNGRFAYWLPREMMRWGEKSREQQTQLQAYRSRIAYWLPPDHAELPEIRQRFAELRTQRHLMTDYPDEPWMYRKKLKEHLQTGLRPAVQQVSASKAEMHPIDRRRKAYVMALADAVQTGAKDDIAELAGFEFPHDPLLSFFVHQEVAELYARSSERDPRLELMHRLHDIHFADPRDRSIRNVAAAIELLVTHADVVESDWDRWDHLNALLQVLKYRWDARSAVPPSSPQVAMNDVEKSVSAMNHAFETMESLASTLGIAPEHWQRRRRYLERNLQRPLRTYRAKLIPHQQKQLKEQLQAETDEPDGAAPDGAALDDGAPEPASLGN